MRIGSLFTGYGGLDMAVAQHYDAETVWTSDIDPGACKIIAHRYPDAPNLGDITTADWSAVEPVDILTGGWPCQPFSHAGKRLGAADARALWPEVARAVRALRPRYVVLENVAAVLTAGELDRALGDLASSGYVGSWRCLRAADVGAPHGRNRCFIVATDTRRTDEQRPAPDAERLSDAGRRDIRDLGGTPEDRRGEAREQRDRDAAHHRSAATPNAERGGRDGRALEPIRGPRDGVATAGRGEVDWGDYEPAVRRWERVLDRPAPAPTQTSPRGSQRLSPRFVEWMMGLPAGWVTDVPGLTRNQQLKALGNGVVPHQALAALGLMQQQESAA